MSLDLKSNAFYNVGASAIADTLTVNSSLRMLNLENNGIHNKGAAAIANALIVNSSLTSLNLKKNRMESEGAFVIAKMLNLTSSLTSLDLSGNAIWMDGTTSLAEILRFHPSLLRSVVNGEFRTCFDRIPYNAVNTQLCLKHLLQLLMGDNGAQCCGHEFRMKFSVVILYR